MTDLPAEFFLRRSCASFNDSTSARLPDLARREDRGRRDCTHSVFHDRGRQFTVDCGIANRRSFHDQETKIKAQKKAEEDENLDEALAETFPASDPPSMTQPRTGADVAQRRPRRHPKEEAPPRKITNQ